jgi:hypothetical protein
MIISNVAVAYRVRYEVSGDPGDLALAIDAGTRCLLDTPGDAYERRGMLSNLGLAADPIAVPIIRALAAAAWAEWSRDDGNLPAAVAGYSAAVELLSMVAWHGLGATAQERHLPRWRDLTRAVR